ncbi:MAG: tetratricopeptide repeat protein [Prevotella sp.]|uniref:tetratricopeptide repeat protein n=1 Tax=Prevotella sp. TaxID=59823 RepID=UPI002A2B502D|nr:tetratricopeptide repeat protein [Prevotella sp.]MDD7318626.1 tetratricopeptide repeat protein [Prevotellaceae bacterium]MDY4019418.1 tetratricopeptide repeat protein [Prevotella sp.]
MDICRLIRHPELMDKETLYDLRSLIALYPYYQTARLLMLQNLYLLHDPTFDEELRRAAIYITDRRVIFNLVEAAHYRLSGEKENGGKDNEESETTNNGDRTLSLIDKFLDSLPKENDSDGGQKRRPTPVEAAVDYAAYLLETESEEERQTAKEAPLMRGQELIDEFIDNNNGRIELQEIPEYIIPEDEEEENGAKESEESYFTETLARIYIKQGQYSKALEIIKRLNLNFPKKNAYFADQIRFLEKLIINNKYKKQ